MAVRRSHFAARLLEHFHDSCMVLARIGRLPRLGLLEAKGHKLSQTAAWPRRRSHALSRTNFAIMGRGFGWRPHYCFLEALVSGEGASVSPSSQHPEQQQKSHSDNEPCHYDLGTRSDRHTNLQKKRSSPTWTAQLQNQQSYPDNYPKQREAENGQEVSPHAAFITSE